MFNKEAARNTAKILGLCTLASLATTAFFTLLSATAITAIFMIGLVLGAIKVCYDVEVNRIKYRDALKETLDIVRE